MATLGGVLTVGALRLGRAAVSYPADADYTLPQSVYENGWLDVGSGTSLGSTRKLIVPITDGLVWAVSNNATGAQSIQVIGTTGTGITIATGKTAMVGSDGTNIRRLTADV